jgi:ABC-2 type transport system permease protein
VLPPDFAADLGAGRTARVQVIVDGSDANTATIALGYAGAVARTFGERVLLRGERLALPVAAESRVWFNEQLESRNMIVPGLVAVIMMIIAAMLTSLTIAREWERGTMEQLAATPVARLEVVLGKLLPYLAIGFVDVAVCSLLGVFLFGVPFRGSVLLLAGLSLLFLIGSLGLGLFISAAARTQVLATQLAMLLTFLPAFILSGFMFALDLMPAPLRAISYVVPARYFLVVTRGIFLKGIGASMLAWQAALMVVYAFVGLGLAAHSFRKEIE